MRVEGDVNRVVVNKIYKNIDDVSFSFTIRHHITIFDI